MAQPEDTKETPQRSENKTIVDPVALPASICKWSAKRIDVVSLILLEYQSCDPCWKWNYSNHFVSVCIYWLRINWCFIICQIIILGLGACGNSLVLSCAWRGRRCSCWIACWRSCCCRCSRGVWGGCFSQRLTGVSCSICHGTKLFEPWIGESSCLQLLFFRVRNHAYWIQGE